MITLKTLTYKNIMSVGNHPMKIDLNGSATTVIGGRNGSGKSTLFLSLVYCLYGKVLNGMKIAQVINTVNKKNLLTTLTFERNGEEWRIERGEKPKKFDLYREGEKIDKYANVRDQQKFLDMILGVDFKSFVQLIVINKERYVPFMDMGASERRKIIEDTLGIAIFRHMNDILKDDIVETKRKYTNAERDRSTLQAEMNGTQQVIKELEFQLKESEQQSQEEISRINDELLRLQSEYNSLTIKMNELSTAGWDKTKEKLKELNKLSIQFDSKIQASNNNISFFKTNDVCPTCNQDISDELTRRIIEKEESTIADVKQTVSQMLEMAEELSIQNKKFEKASSDFSEYSSQQNQLAFQMRSYEKDLKRISEASNLDSKREKVETYINAYNEQERRLEALTESLNAIHTEQEQLEMLKETLKDDGVKTFIVNEYLNIINKKINEYLNAMEFYLNIKLNENFEESFHSMNREGLTYENLSSGQKMRVNLAITLALLEVSAIKNSIAINILCLDELTSPLDKEGCVNFMDLISLLLKDRNIFIVDQRFEMFEEMCDSSIQFKLNSGFTELV